MAKRRFGKGGGEDEVRSKESELIKQAATRRLGGQLGSRGARYKGAVSSTRRSLSGAGLSGASDAGPATSPLAARRAAGIQARTGRGGGFGQGVGKARLSGMIGEMGTTAGPKAAPSNPAAAANVASIKVKMKGFGQK